MKNAEISRIIKKSKDNLATRNYREEERVSEIFEWYESSKVQSPRLIWKKAKNSPYARKCRNDPFLSKNLPLFNLNY